jgi:hypothetical protein
MYEVHKFRPTTDLVINALDVLLSPIVPLDVYLMTLGMLFLVMMVTGRLGLYFIIVST